MTVETQLSSVNDFSALARLKTQAGEDNPQAIRQAARQVEALFLQMMLKSMRDAGAAFGEERDRSYEEMFDQQIALELAQKDSIGIADLLMRQMELVDPSAVENSIELDSFEIPPRNSSSVDLSTSTEAEVRVNATHVGLSSMARQSSPEPVMQQREDFSVSSPEEFVAELWPLAQKAADRLGIDPRGIVAQAALETGWGEKLMRDNQGVSGNNLFGVKVGSDWEGEHLSVTSLEHEDGTFVPRRSQFRAYPNLEAGIEGFADFLRNSNLYTDALRRGSDPHAYAEELQAAGYATDPQYHDKISRILNSDRFAQYLNSIEATE